MVAAESWTRRTVLALGTVLAFLASLLVTAQQNPTSDLETTAFVCPMHPDYTLEIAGTCPRCGMALVKATPFDVRDYGFEFTTTPALVQPGRPARWRFTIAHPGTGQQVTKFEPVHERQYHLFVISHDMEHFQHIHPEQQPDGTWAIDVTLPKAGAYKVLSDFLPSGGAAQLVARPLVTAGYSGDLVTAGASLVPDVAPKKTIDDITATVSFDPPTFVAGLYGHLIFDLTDTQTGRPITDLQTYLGAFGHTLIMSEDMLDYVHTHPLDILASGDDDTMPHFVIPPGADLEKIRGGPQVIFDGLMPKPGRYRAWTQFRRNNRLYTFTSTFVVAAAP
jgi:Heavy metal binding domain